MLIANVYLAAAVLTTLGLMIATRQEVLHFRREGDLTAADPGRTFRRILIRALHRMRFPVAATLMLMPATALPAGRAEPADYLLDRAAGGCQCIGRAWR